tara:strand:+ start:625 stop:927 length:303 start_codon:yes stop_codon:yes gene_type:complete
MVSEEKDYEVINNGEIPVEMLVSAFGTRTIDLFNRDKNLNAQFGIKAYQQIINAYEKAINNPKDRDIFYLKTFVNGLCSYLENHQKDIEAFRRKKLEENN